MTKKEYILKLLNALKGERDLAESLIVLVQNDAFDDKTIDVITNVFRNAVKSVSIDIKKKKFQKGLEIMQKIKSQEDIENEKEEAEFLDIEKELEGL